MRNRNRMEYHTACSLGENVYESSLSIHSASFASVAQLVEHSPDTRTVVGSTPTACTEDIMQKSSSA